MEDNLNKKHANDHFCYWLKNQNERGFLQSNKGFKQILFLIAKATIFLSTSPHHGANGSSFLISFVSTFHSIEKIRKSENLIAANLAAQHKVIRLRLSRHVVLCACVQRGDRIFFVHNFRFYCRLLVLEIF